MDAITKLRELGLHVDEYTPTHFVVEESIDLWFSQVGCKWRDRRDGLHGKKPAEQLPFFIQWKLGQMGPHEHRCQQCDKLLKDGCECENGNRMDWCSSNCRAAFDL